MSLEEEGANVEDLLYRMGVPITKLRIYWKRVPDEEGVYDAYIFGYIVGEYKASSGSLWVNVHEASSVTKRLLVDSVAKRFGSPPLEVLDET